MAINPYTQYPGRCSAPSSNYPYGAARNESVEGADDGFPLSSGWVKDLQGFFQCLLSRAGITPSEDPDTVLASDYMDALTGVGTPIIPLGALADGELDITRGNAQIKANPTRIATIDTVTANQRATLSRYGLEARADDGGDLRRINVGGDAITFYNVTGAPYEVKISRAQYACSASGWPSNPTDGWYGRTDNLTLTGLEYGCRIRHASISFKTALGLITAPLSILVDDSGGTARITQMKCAALVSPAIGTEIIIDIEFDRASVYS